LRLRGQIEPCLKVESVAMRNLKLTPSLGTMGIAIASVIVLLGALPLRAEGPSAAAARIQAYYQELMPTIQQAGRLSVRERDKRFAPAITAAFDLASMTRLAVGPPWQSFSPAQQAAAQQAFTRFLVADYASQISDYSGESFVVEPQTSPASRGGGEIVQSKLLQPGGRIVKINYLVRGGRVIDVLNGTISDLATRRDEFASIIASGGAPALIKRLQDRTQSLLGKRSARSEGSVEDARDEERSGCCAAAWRIICAQCFEVQIGPGGPLPSNRVHRRDGIP